MRSIDTFPTNEIHGVHYRIGHVFPFGATVMDRGVNLSIFSKEATGCTLLLFHQGEKDPTPSRLLIFMPKEDRNTVRKRTALSTSW